MYHIDALSFPHIDRVGPVDDLSFLSDGSVEFIYACHVLEHFGRHEFQRVLNEWSRVLAPGGVLRLAVPDFEMCAKLYAEGRLAGGISDVIGLIVGGQKDPYDFHKIIFDRPSLTQALLRAGFQSVREWNWRETDHSDMDDYSQAYLPHMQQATGDLVSLNLEGVK
ncbi:MAG: methyltransferase domain-containing protein [Hyphomonadaceae bacterium]